jgi:hypothetical protein
MRTVFAGNERGLVPDPFQPIQEEQFGPDRQKRDCVWCERVHHWCVVRCCATYLAIAHSALVVGSDKYGTHGAHGSQKHLTYKIFETYKEAAAYCHECGCHIFGVEVIDGSRGKLVHMANKPYDTWTRC